MRKRIADPGAPFQCAETIAHIGHSPLKTPDNASSNRD